VFGYLVSISVLVLFPLGPDRMLSLLLLITYEQKQKLRAHHTHTHRGKTHTHTQRHACGKVVLEKLCCILAGTFHKINFNFHYFTCAPPSLHCHKALRLTNPSHPRPGTCRGVSSYVFPIFRPTVSGCPFSSPLVCIDLEGRLVCEDHLVLVCVCVLPVVCVCVLCVCVCFVCVCVCCVCVCVSVCVCV